MSDVTLKEFLETRINEYNKAHADIHVLLQRSVDKTEQQLSQRLEGMNEFRQQLDRQASLFVTRDMQEGLKSAVYTEMRRVEDVSHAETQRINSDLGGQLKPLVEFQKEFTGRLLLIGGVVTAINIGIALVSHFVK